MKQADIPKPSPTAGPSTDIPDPKPNGGWNKWFSKKNQPPQASALATSLANEETSTPIVTQPDLNNPNNPNKPKNYQTVPGFVKKRKLTRQQARARIELIRKYAKLLDAIPGLPIKIGLDGIIGLIPGVGDLSTGILSVILIYIARDLDLPKSVQSKMVMNIVIDTGVGVIPLFGDVFDVMFKANLKNLKLIETWFEKNLDKFEDEIQS